jgi:hypothetical protein
MLEFFFGFIIGVVVGIVGLGCWAFSGSDPWSDITPD